MFEIIGLLGDIALLFAFSSLVGGVYALVAWIIVRSQAHSRKRRIAIAAALPPAFAAYILACAIAFSIFVPGHSELLFGSISEGLPNGYRLMALGKMPRYGRIEAPSGDINQPTANGYFGSVEVDGPLVFGAYDSRYDASPGDGNQGYFAFDTRSGKVLDFGTLPELNRYAGHSAHFTENQSFRSAEASQKRLFNVERWIWFAPPHMCTAFYFLFLLKVR
jgi:hypothetical protein